MSAHAATDTMTEDFETALEAAREVARLEVDGNIRAPHKNFDVGTVEEAVAALAAPYKPILIAEINEPDADEVDGLAPDTPRHAQSFVFDALLDTDTTPAFEVVTEYENRYGDTRVAIETPAPWDTEGFDGKDANAIVKGLPWGEDDAAEADDYEPSDGAYYTFDADDRLAPDETWVVDDRAVDELRQRATAEGYEWEDARTPSDAGEDALDRLTAFAEQGDSVEVRYEKKNGSGIGSKAGEVEAVSTGEDGHTQGMVIRRDDDGVTKVRRDDDGEPGVFSTSRYPFMGEPVSVEVIPSDDEE